MQNNILLGAVALIVAEALFSGISALVKHLSDSLSQSQLIFFRNLFALLCLTPWMISRGSINFKTKRLGLHCFRAFTGLTGMYCFFYALANMPFAQAVLALKMAPFFVPIIAAIWWREVASLKTWVGILIGFVAAVLIIDPQQALNYSHLGVGLLCAMLVAITKCTLRQLSDTEPSLRIVFYFALACTLFSFPPLLFDWQTIANEQWLLLIIIGVVAASAQMAMTKAYQLASPVKIGLLGYSSIAFAAIIGSLIWQESITTSTLLGIGLLFLAANMSVRQRWLW